MPPIVIVGLGNPGPAYETTRHNVGYLVIDELCRILRKELRGGRGRFSFCAAEVDDKRVVLAKPATFMNSSGEAVADLLDRYGSSHEELLVVFDDFWLPLGSIRVRKKGGDGGHNGLASIIYHLNSNEFARIRCGIKKEVMPPKSEMAEFVLTAFETVEQPAVRAMVTKAADAAREFVASGIARTMNRFNI